MLEAYNYTYVEATWTQGLNYRIGSQQRSFTFLNGVAEIMTPYNLRLGLSKEHHCEPDINSTNQDFATHYGVEIIPVRVRRLKDKAKSEGVVLIVERWNLAAMSNRMLLPLLKLNQVISKLLKQLNTRPIKKLPGCRQEMLYSLDQPAIHALPATAYALIAGGRRSGSHRLPCGDQMPLLLCSLSSGQKAVRRPPDRAYH